MLRRTLLGSLLAAPCLLQGQQGKGLARERFFASGEAGGALWAGVRITLLLQREEAGKPCVLREVDTHEVFRAGDGVRLRLQPNREGYLYVLVEGASGEGKLLFPLEHDGERAHQAGAYQVVDAPRGEWLRFDEEPGVEPFRVFFSRKPVARLEALRTKTGSTLPARDLKRLVASLAADEQEREEETSRHGSVPVMYAVAKLEGEDEVLMDRFELAHRPARRSSTSSVE